MAKPKKEAKLITAVRIRPDRAERLRNKSISLTLQMKELITEADIVNFMIETVTPCITLDEDGYLTIDTENLDNSIFHYHTTPK
jgi:hypothetical protein